MNDGQKTELVDSMKEAADMHGKHVRSVNLDSIADYKPSLWWRFKTWVEEHNRFAGYVIVSSADEYIKMPWKSRSVFRFWYLHGLINDGWNIVGSKKDRVMIKDFIKTNHPIQYFVRENASKLCHKLELGYDWLRHTVNPRQKWLTKQIPKSWSDKVWLIPEINFAMVVHFVEGEDCFGSTNYENSGEGHVAFAEGLRDCYDYIKNRRPKLQEDYEKSFPDEDTRTGNYSVDYAENTRLELLINKEDTRYLVWIVTNRDYFWT